MGVAAQDVGARGEAHRSSSATAASRRSASTRSGRCSFSDAAGAVADAQDRVDRAEGVLEDHRHAAAHLATRGARPGRWPSKVIVPTSAGRGPASTRAMVDLPEPDSPTSATISPGATSKETSSVACSVPRDRNPPTRKYRLSPSTFRTASAHGAPLGFTRWQRTAWPSRSISSGRNSRHSSVANGQRGAKRQPGGVDRPATAGSRRCPVSSFGSPTMDGKGVHQTARVGVARVGRRPRGSRRARRSPRRTSRPGGPRSATPRSCRGSRT